MREYAVTLLGCLLVLAAALTLTDRAGRVDDPPPLQLDRGAASRSAADRPQRQRVRPPSRQMRRRDAGRRRVGSADVRRASEREGERGPTAADDGAAPDRRDDRPDGGADADGAAPDRRDDRPDGGADADGGGGDDGD